IEKAHPDVFNILLQVMDDGILNDNLGHKVSFKNTVVIMTSNVGARLISRGKSLGFMAPDEKQDERDYKKMKETVMEEVKRVFNPEFINRINEIIVFHSLNEDEMRQILKLMLTRLRAKIEVQNYKIEFTQSAEDYLLKTGFDANYGARPLQRTIQRSVEDPLSEEILLKRFEAGGTIVVDLDAGGEKLAFTSRPTPVSQSPS
ncbi:MAG: AAA family ATPase, partial [Elusimicrobia bacterium]|nr:AAA family ATPase [Elusimicrobiota bacterium]